MASSKEFLASHLNGRDLIKIILENEKEMKKIEKKYGVERHLIHYT